MLPHLSEEGAVTAIAERCVASLEAPLKLNDRDIELGVSMGIAIFKNNYSVADSLLSDASIAQRIAITDRTKNSNFNFINLGARLAAQQHYQVETDLRRTIRRNEITPYLQPIVDLATGKPVGLECLMRWRTDSSEMLLPDKFLSISHLAGLSGELDLQIIQKAIHASHELATAAPGRPLQLSVNLSALLLENEGQRNRLLQLIRSTPLPKNWQLQVELVEDYLQDNGSELGAFLNTLRRQGVAIAIDDFGTGYSSLSRLHNYPVRSSKLAGDTRTPLEHALTDGEDFELILAMPPDAAHNLIALVGTAPISIPITIIGEVTQGAGLVAIGIDGTSAPLKPQGFLHVFDSPSP